MQEILAVDGWVAATRYRLDAAGRRRRARVGIATCRCTSSTSSPSVAVANLAAAGMGNADTYIDMKSDDPSAHDPLPLPDWFAGIRFASWNATGTSERIVPN